MTSTGREERWGSGCVRNVLVGILFLVVGVVVAQALHEAYGVRLGFRGDNSLLAPVVILTLGIVSTIAAACLKHASAHDERPGGPGRS